LDVPVPVLDYVAEQVDAGERVSRLEGWRRAPTKTTGTALVQALQRADQVAGLGVGALNLDSVPWRGG
jgi:hypothetical protein